MLMRMPLETDLVSGTNLASGDRANIDKSPQLKHVGRKISGSGKENRGHKGVKGEHAGVEFVQ